MPNPKLFYGSKTLRQYCIENNLKYACVMDRIRRWYTIDEAIVMNDELLYLPWEEWREIKRYEWYYDVSNLWRVRTYWKRSNNWAELKSTPQAILRWRKKYQTTVYRCHTLYREFDRKYHYKTSRLVAQAFLYLDYNDKSINVIFKNNDWTDNRLENLMLWSASDRVFNSIKNWRRHTQNKK